MAREHLTAADVYLKNAGAPQKLLERLHDYDTAIDVLEAASGSGGSLGYYNVQAFNVVGDGVTDNRVALQALVDQVAAAGGGRIFFPPGRYVVSQRPAGGVENQACIRVYKATPAGPEYRNITFEGAGPTSQIVMHATVVPFKAVALFVVANGAETIRFHRLRFVQRFHTEPLDEQTHLIKVWGNPTLATATGSDAGPRFVQVTDCDFGCVEGDQIQIIGEEDHPIEDVLVSRSEFRGRLDENFDVTVLGTRSAVAIQRAVARGRIAGCYMEESDDQLIDFEPTSLGSDDYFVISDNVLNGRPGTTVLAGSGVGATSPNVGLIISGNTILNGTVHAINIRQVVFVGNHVKVPSSPSSNGPVGFTRTVDLCVIANNTIDVGADNAAFDVVQCKGDAFGTPNHTVVAGNTIRWDSCANGVYLESCNHCVVASNTFLATSTVPTSEGVEGMDQKCAVVWVPVQAGTGRGVSCTGNVLDATGLAMQAFFSDGGGTGEVVVTGNSARGVASGYRQQNAPLSGNVPVVAGNFFAATTPVSVTTGGFACVGGNGAIAAAGQMDLIGPDGSTASPNTFAALDGVGVGSTYRVRAGNNTVKKLWVKDVAGATGWVALY
jgi:hypothetical protein